MGTFVYFLGVMYVNGLCLIPNLCKYFVADANDSRKCIYCIYGDCFHHLSVAED